MTAKEMFEELGYIYYKDEFEIECLKNEGKPNHKFISFDLDDKTVKPYHCYAEPLNGYFEMQCIDLTVEELKSIHKQCQELGWLDD